MIHPNTLTLSRLLLAGLLPYYLLQESLTARLIGITLFTVAGLTDAWDGHLARQKGLESSLGKILDPIADKALILIAFFTLAHLKLYSVFWVLPIFIRELIITGARFRALKRGIVLAAEFPGKIKTILQFVSISVSFLCLLLRDYGSPGFLGTSFFALQYFFLLVAVLATLYSGWRFFFDNPGKVWLTEPLATGLYLGFLPKMPGTWGTLGGLAGYLLCPQEARWVLTLLCIPVALVSSHFHQKRVTGEDPQEIVIDEIAGITITLSGIALTGSNVILGFVLFRFFDILKPPPLRWLEKRKGAIGIVADDIAAGIYAHLLLRLFSWIL